MIVSHRQREREREGEKWLSVWVLLRYTDFLGLQILFYFFLFSPLIGRSGFYSEIRSGEPHYRRIIFISLIKVKQV